MKTETASRPSAQFYRNAITDLFCALLDTPMSPEVKNKVEKFYLNAMNATCESAGHVLSNFNPTDQTYRCENCGAIVNR